MRDKYILIFAVLLSTILTPALASHFEGRETNVIMLDCDTDTEHMPPLIKIIAYSKNTTRAHIPIITKDKPCAQALHELLTAGFTIQKYDNAGKWDFLLIRIDESKEEH